MIYLPTKKGLLWSNDRPFPYFKLLAAALNKPAANYLELQPPEQLTVMMAYLILGHDWGEYGLYALAERELQRFTRIRLYTGQYLDLTASTLPPEAGRLYAILNREYCRVFYESDNHPDD